MTLLGVNRGFGNADCATFQFANIEKMAAEYRSEADMLCNALVPDTPPYTARQRRK